MRNIWNNCLPRIIAPFWCKQRNNRPRQLFEEVRYFDRSSLRSRRLEIKGTSACYTISNVNNTQAQQVGQNPRRGRFSTETPLEPEPENADLKFNASNEEGDLYASNKQRNRKNISQCISNAKAILWANWTCFWIISPKIWANISYRGNKFADKLIPYRLGWASVL